MLHSQRIDSLRRSLPANTALLISDPLDIYYLTGFWSLTPEREAFLFLTAHTAMLLLSSFSEAPQIEGLETSVGSIERNLQEKIQSLFETHSIRNITLDGGSLYLKEYELLKRIFPTVLLTSSTNSPVLESRMVKVDTEIEALAHANHITHNAITFALSQLTAGMTEQDIQLLIEKNMREQGAFELAFPTIVAFGDHSALPHHQPSNRPLRGNDAVLIDCGAKWQHYCADVTRTVWFGNTPDPEFAKIENVVKNAYQKAVVSCKLSVVSTVESQHAAPLQATSLDKTARDLITAAGYGQQFIHTTGHGVGLYIHEQPSLNLHNETVLKPGMVITIEPGIYLEGKFGYRFENSIALTENSAQELL